MKEKLVILIQFLVHSSITITQEFLRDRTPFEGNHLFVGFYLFVLCILLKMNCS